ncbi:hypothetical protein [Clostridium hydrogeniformans]|uniref:hypothetical protein n=1 Tax=Clostridium hydrogeniformans TaxID=349933 RepID=UPI000484A6AA|nr:hypothetical protein [Clostridium hydrogeniformans]
MAGEGNKGWVSLYRSIQDHWLWQEEEKYTKLQAWLYLLLSANHKEGKALIGNELVTVEVGCRITSIKKLMKKWGWGNTKVRNFLKLLEEENMIEYSGEKYTLIRILNYEKYQKQTDKTPDIPMDSVIKQIDSKSTTNREQIDSKSQTNTNNNDNNENNDNNDNNYTSDSNECRLAEYLFNHIKSNNPKTRKPNFQTWSKEFDKILRIDNRDLEEVKELIVFSQKHEFWHRNILSPSSLRKQYDRLLLEKIKPIKQTYQKKESNFNNFDQRTYDFESLERKLLGWDKEE